MAIIVLPGTVPLIGDLPISRGMRNGVIPPGPGAYALGLFLNGIIGRRMKVLFRNFIRPTECYNSTAAADTWRGHFHTSPSCDRVICRMILAPVDDTATNAPDPRITWTTTISGGASTAQSTIHYTGPRVVSGSTIVPDQYEYVDQTWTLTRNTSYEVVLNQADKLRVLGAVIYELPKSELDTSIDLVIDTRQLVPALGIFDRDSQDVLGDLITAYKRQASHFLSYCVPSTTARTTTSTSFVNVLDATTAAVGADTEGWYTYPQVHSTYEGYSSGTNRELVSVRFTAHMQISDAGQTATLVLCDSNAGTGAPIATLTMTGSTSGAWQTVIASWSAPSNAAMKLEAYLKTSNVSATASVRAISVYQYET